MEKLTRLLAVPKRRSEVTDIREAVRVTTWKGNHRRESTSVLSPEAEIRADPRFILSLREL